MDGGDGPVAVVAAAIGHSAGSRTSWRELPYKQKRRTGVVKTRLPRDRREIARNLLERPGPRGTPNKAKGDPAHSRRIPLPNYPQRSQNVGSTSPDAADTAARRQPS